MSLSPPLSLGMDLHIFIYRILISVSLQGSWMNVMYLFIMGKDHYLWTVNLFSNPEGLF